MLHPPGFYYVKKTREVAFWTFIRRWNHKPLRFFDIIKPRRIEHLQSEEPFFSDPYFSIVSILHSKRKIKNKIHAAYKYVNIMDLVNFSLIGTLQHFQTIQQEREERYCQCYLGVSCKNLHQVSGLSQNTLAYFCPLLTTHSVEGRFAVRAKAPRLISAVLSHKCKFEPGWSLSTEIVIYY